jgi:hypothetical protein
MPVFDQGYRPYEGPRRGRVLRWWPISVACLRTVRKWPFVLALVAGAVPMIVKLSQAYMIGNLAGLGPAERFGEFDDRFFFEAVSWETFLVVLLLWSAGAGQIAEDLRSGALQIYFGKPITQLDYVLGKLGTVVLAASLLTVVPGLVVLLGGIAFAPDSSFLTGNPLLPLEILAFALLVAVVLGTLALGVSSLARRGWIAGVALVGGYVFSIGLGKALPEILDDPRWQVVHLGNGLDAVGWWIFTGSTGTAAPLGAAGAVIGIVVLGSLLLLARRVRSAEVVA